MEAAHSNGFTIMSYDNNQGLPVVYAVGLKDHLLARPAVTTRVVKGEFTLRVVFLATAYRADPRRYEEIDAST